MYYILQNNQPIPVDYWIWYEWQFEPKHSVIKNTLVNDLFIRTIFLGTGIWRYVVIVATDEVVPKVWYEKFFSDLDDALKEHTKLIPKVRHGI